LTNALYLDVDTWRLRSERVAPRENVDATIFPRRGEPPNYCLGGSRSMLAGLDADATEFAAVVPIRALLQQLSMGACREGLISSSRIPRARRGACG
jgi:hypothetical protein